MLGVRLLQRLDRMEFQELLQLKEGSLVLLQLLHPILLLLAFDQLGLQDVGVLDVRVKQLVVILGSLERHTFESSSL